MKIIPVCVYEFEILSGKGKGAIIRLGVKQGRQQFKRVTTKLNELLIAYGYKLEGQKTVYTTANDNFEYSPEWLKITYDTMPGIFY